jgi:hypothetical protein
MLSIQKFFGAATVGVGADEFGGLGQFGFVVEHPGSVQVDVGEEERHRATLGDLLGFGQVLAGEVVLPADEVVERCGEQAAGKFDCRPCGAEAVDFAAVIARNASPQSDIAYVAQSLRRLSFASQRLYQ